MFYQEEPASFLQFLTARLVFIACIVPSYILHMTPVARKNRRANGRKPLVNRQIDEM